MGHFVGPDPQKAYEVSGVEDNCQGSSRTLAQGLAWGYDQQVNLAIATDFMGMARGVAPRKGGHGQCLNNKEHQKAQKDLPGSGDETFDEAGLAHIGLVGALMRDLHYVGLKPEYLKHVQERSAENFIQMWEKAWRMKK